MNKVDIKVEIDDNYSGTRIDNYDNVEDFNVLQDGSVLISWEGGGTLLPFGSFRRLNYEEVEED